MKTVRSILTSLTAFVIAGSLQLSPALAAGPPEAGNNFLGGRIEVTFIKWVTAATPPVGIAAMAGVVTGDVGAGQFVGEVLSLEFPDSNTVKVHALYHINGGAYSFTADNVVTQDNVKGTAVINGTVISPGPLNGARVQGEYQVIYPCGITNAQVRGAFDNFCFQGTLVVRPGRGHR